MASPQQPPYTYTAIDSAAGEFRVLRVWECVDPNAAVRCSLHKVSLTSDRAVDKKFEALSHTWGTTPAEEEEEDILVDGRTFPVRKNVAAVLRRFSLRPGIVSWKVWIDAVCINQQDRSETLQQISLMRRIYSQATRVSVWLGQDSKWEDVVTHPWWSRVWVIQEAVLNKKLCFMYGSTMLLPWEKVEKGLTKKTPSGNIVVGDAFRIINRLRQKAPAARNMWDPSILMLLYECRSLGCADPRDRIYGVLGLAPMLLAFGVGTASPGDGSVTTASLYANLVRKVIKETGSLDILNFARAWRHDQTIPDQDRVEMANLPFWAPNWMVKTSRDPAPLLDWSDTTFGAAGRYKAGKLLNAILENGSDSRQLILRGVRHDMILDVGDPWHPNTQSDAALPISRDGIPELQQWERLAFTYDSKGDFTRRKEDLLRTYIADFDDEYVTPNRRDLSVYVESWCDGVGWAKESASSPSPSLPKSESQLRENAAWGKHTKKLMDDSRPLMMSDVHGNLFRSIPQVQAMKDRLELQRHAATKYLAYAKRIYDVCAHRRLLVTKQGYIGLAPWNANIGDVVAVLYGGETPFLLRPRRSEPGVYRFVGECFVQGLMGGEAMSEETAAAKVRNFRIL